jgi:peptide/nickel transport system substrate-binding protein
MQHAVLAFAGALKAPRLKSFVGAGLLAAATALTPVGASAENLVIAGVSAPTSVDPDVWTPGTIETMVNVYEGLVQYGFTVGEDGSKIINPTEIVPHLAESWEVNEDGTEYVFKLREDAVSPYGNRLTAQDVVWSWDLAAERNQTGGFLRRTAAVTSVEAVDESHVKFTLSAPRRMFLQILALYTPHIVDTTEALKHATDADPKALEWLRQNTAGFGAYHLAQLRPGEAALFEANPNYPFEKPYYDRVMYREVPAPANRVALLQGGDVSIAEEIPLDQIVNLQSDDRTRVTSVPGTASASLRINVNMEPFDDKLVRQAVAWALDYDALNANVFRDQGVRARSVLAPDNTGYVEAYEYDHDPEKAKALLAEAGYPDGVDITLEYASAWWWEEPLAIQVADQLGRSGFRVNLVKLPNAEMAARRNATEQSSPFFMHSANAFALDPTYSFSLQVYSTGVGNNTGYNSEVFDGLVDQALVEQDDAKWLELVAEAQEVVAEDAPVIPTFYPGTWFVRAPCITGNFWQPHNRVMWRHLTCEQ